MPLLLVPWEEGLDRGEENLNPGVIHFYTSTGQLKPCYQRVNPFHSTVGTAISTELEGLSSSG